MMGQLRYVEAVKLSSELASVLEALREANEYGTITDTLWFSDHQPVFDKLEELIISMKEVLPCQN
jgi:hypothetical protein